MRLARRSARSTRLRRQARSSRRCSTPPGKDCGKKAVEDGAEGARTVRARTTASPSRGGVLGPDAPTALVGGPRHATRRSSAASATTAGRAVVQRRPGAARPRAGGGECRASRQLRVLLQPRGERHGVECVRGQGQNVLPGRHLPLRRRATAPSSTARAARTSPVLVGRVRAVRPAQARPGLRRPEQFIGRSRGSRGKVPFAGEEPGGPGGGCSAAARAVPLARAERQGTFERRRPGLARAAEAPIGPFPTRRPAMPGRSGPPITDGSRAAAKPGGQFRIQPRAGAGRPDAPAGPISTSVGQVRRAAQYGHRDRRTRSACRTACSTSWAMTSTALHRLAQHDGPRAAKRRGTTGRCAPRVLLIIGLEDVGFGLASRCHRGKGIENAREAADRRVSACRCVCQVRLGTTRRRGMPTIKVHATVVSPARTH